MNRFSFNNILFVGGVHGVGKSTICQRLSSDLNATYLSASEILGWQKINIDVKNKFVNDIPDTQDRLIRGLRNVIKPNHRYILDGHFCLFDKQKAVTKVPLITFSSINPIFLIVVIGDTADISKKLQYRDQKIYLKESLSEMQDVEIQYATEISLKLDIPLKVLDINKRDQSYTDLLLQINESFT